MQIVWLEEILIDWRDWFVNSDQLRELYATMIDLKNRFNKINTATDNLINALNDSFQVGIEGLYVKEIRDTKEKANAVKSDIVVRDIPNIEKLLESNVM